MTVFDMLLPMMRGALRSHLQRGAATAHVLASELDAHHEGAGVLVDGE